MQSLTPEFDYRPCSKGPSFVILLLLLCSISSCLTLLVNIVGERPAPAPTCANASPRIAKTAPASQAKDLPTCVPQDSFKMKYDNDPDYEGWSTNVTEHWAALLPANNGLGQEDSFNEGIPYGIAMFHQLHCLHAIREYYTILLGAPGVDAADAELVRSVGQRAHIGHCFNWVRQALLCHADDTREIQVHDPSGKLVDDTVRVCRRIEGLYEATKNPKAIKANI